ncbi:MAG: ribosome biogenesis/translation initiation ATPase RLI [Euryarchaeota archaeon]|nr:ribosome biogenesis/translation initiation ATPase RLI [Euryarchaeota archaeon]
MPRIAVIDRNRCQPKKCGTECIKYCPRVRAGDETVKFAEDGKPIIIEELCPGCGICTHKCPFEAIMIINLPEELAEDCIHQYGPNGFRLYRLPIPRFSSVTGIIGPNGVGKTTAIRVLAGEVKPNLGRLKEKLKWDDIIQIFSGTELQNYFTKLVNKRIKVVHKPQEVDKLPRAVRGVTHKLLERVDERGIVKDLIDKLQLKEVLDRKLSQLSGGELQRVAIAAAIAKESDVIIFDEPSSYLDIYQRLNTAKVIREQALSGKAVIVIEHDLAVLDYLSDYVHVMYGQPTGYGVVSSPKSVRVGINVYLQGYLKEENIRFRKEPVKFEVRPPTERWEGETLVRFKNIVKRYEGFEVKVEQGEVCKGEVIGVLGPNATGKTTFARILAGEIKPNKGTVDKTVTIAYKPQYITTKIDEPVAEYLRKANPDKFGTSIYNTEILRPLDIKPLYDRLLSELSGGELQRVVIAATLSKDTQFYLLDEPSAHLDVEQRMAVAKVIRRIAEKREAGAMVIDHDILFLDYISDRLMVFLGKPGITGDAFGPFDLRTGMNTFLKEVGVTFRRDETTGRPRVNKADSYLDREQKRLGEYYYTVITPEKSEA